MSNYDPESKKDDKLTPLYAAMFGNSEPTPEEIAAVSIVKNTKETISVADALARLGITQEDLDSLRKRKARGSRGAYYTAKDADIVLFLALGKYCTDSILAMAQGVAVSTMEKHLKRLIAKKVVKRLTIPGMKPVYALTAHGVEISGYDGKVVTEGNINYDNIQPTLGACWIMATFWSVEKNYVAEWQYRSDLMKRNGRASGTFKELVTESKLLWHDWEKKKDPATSPELTNLYLYSLLKWDDLGIASMYHCPDLVKVYPRAEDGSPQSIAFEIERKAKGKKEYKRILTSYKDDRFLFKKVIWYAANDSIAKQISEACTELHMSPEKCFITFPYTKNEKGEKVRYRGGDFTKM